MSIRFEDNFIYIGDSKFNVNMKVHGKNVDLDNPQIREKILKLVQELKTHMKDLEDNKQLQISTITNRVSVKKTDLKDIETSHLFEVKGGVLERVLIPPRFIPIKGVENRFKDDTLIRTYTRKGDEVARQRCVRLPAVFKDIEYVENELKRTDLTPNKKQFLNNQRLALYAYLEQGYRELLKSGVEDGAVPHDKVADARKLLESPDIFTLQHQKPPPDLTKYMRDLKQFCIENNLQSWLGASYARKSLLEAHGYEEGWKRYISAPVNARYHEIGAGADMHKVLRVGVFSDMRNGFISLKKLKEIKAADDPQKVLEDLKKELFDKTYFNSALKKHFLSQITLDKLDGLIEEREYFLEKQLGHLIATQVDRHPELLKDGVFHLGHISFLRENRHEIDKRGWIVDEKTEMEDMAEIFKKFDGKTIHFDLKNAPFSLQDDGIHLQGDRDSITLKTHFVNISVQGSTKKTPAQDGLNRDAFRSLRDIVGDDAVNGLIEKLRKQTTRDAAYNAAKDFVKSLLESSGIALSIGCLSAKDRTGQVIDDIFTEMVNDALLTPDKPFKGDEIFQTRIAQENAEGQTGLKIDPRQAAARGKFIHSVHTLVTSGRNAKKRIQVEPACEALSEVAV